MSHISSSPQSEPCCCPSKRCGVSTMVTFIAVTSVLYFLSMTLCQPLTSDVSDHTYPKILLWWICVLGIGFWDPDILWHIDNIIYRINNFWDTCRQHQSPVYSRHRILSAHTMPSSIKLCLPPLQKVLKIKDFVPTMTLSRSPDDVMVSDNVINSWNF